MRLGKKKEKEKENEPKSQTVDGVTRLICSAKTHNIPLRGKMSCLYLIIFIHYIFMRRMYYSTFYMRPAPLTIFDYMPLTAKVVYYT